MTLAELIGSALAAVGSYAAAHLTARGKLAEMRDARDARADAARAADATGRHAVAAAEVAMVPQLLARIAALETAREKDHEHYLADLGTRDARIDALEHSLVERDATIATLSGQMAELRDALAALLGRPSLPPPPR